MMTEQENPIPESDRVEEEIQEEQQVGGEEEELSTDEIESLFVETDSPEQDEPQSPEEITLRKQRTWGERFVQWFKRSLRIG